MIRQLIVYFQGRLLFWATGGYFSVFFTFKKNQKKQVNKTKDNERSEATYLVAGWMRSYQQEGNGIFNVHSDFGAYCTCEGEIGTDERAQVLNQNWETVHCPLASRSQNQASGFTVQCVGQPSMSSCHLLLLSLGVAIVIIWLIMIIWRTISIYTVPCLSGALS